MFRVKNKLLAFNYVQPSSIMFTNDSPPLLLKTDQENIIIHDDGLVNEKEPVIPQEKLSLLPPNKLMRIFHFLWLSIEICG
jgi:hypothetical protein